MRITLESDYALRIVTALARNNRLLEAKTLAEDTQVTPRFTLKILHKLVQGGFVSSQKGAKGGYLLKLSPSEITLKDVIELIDGPIAMSRCLDESGVCSLNRDKSSCMYHHIFEKISLDVANKLASITIKDILDGNFSI